MGFVDDETEFEFEEHENEGLFLFRNGSFIFSSMLFFEKRKIGQENNLFPCIFGDWFQSKKLREFFAEKRRS